MSAVGLPQYYAILEVEREADEATIRKAYRKLVLQWHPDKHPTNREAAEEKIREVNDAYETLGNPFKRGQYDQQILALERKARGYRLDTTAIKPRMSIPKEFMLAPMGHPEKFVRTTGMSLFVHSRSDAKMEFYDFFRDTKFSLWWLPEVNNMCRLRPTASAGVGQDGGLNFNFFLHYTVQVSEVVLSPNCMPDCANVIAVASPVFPRAFRFESRHFPGHYLAFKPPTHLRMMGGIVDETTAIDFVLVDYAQMFQYITTQEVLTPAVTKLGGDRQFIPLDTLREHGDVKLYFKNVLQKPMWEDDDFETFFQSRSGDWDYDSKRREVRLRSPHEQLANSLRRSRNTAEVAACISGSADYDVCLLPIDTLEAMLEVLAKPPPANADVSLAVNILDAQNKLLVALPKACEQDVSFRRLLSVYKQAANFGGPQVDAKILKRRTETARELADIVSDEIAQSRRVADHINLSVFTELCEMPLSWRLCSDRLAKIADRLLDRERLDILVPLIRCAVKALPGSLPLAERLADLAMRELRHADKAVVAEALDALVSGGLCLDSIPASLRRVLKSASFPLVANIVAGLGERGTEGSDMLSCAAFVGEEAADLEALPPGTLLRLAVAATKSADVAEQALDAVAAAASITLASWTMDDASKLLLAVAKPKAGSGGPGVTSLYKRSCEALGHKLQECSSVQLIKVVLAIGPVAHCRPLLEAATKEVIRNRMADLESNHKLLFTQGVLPLGEKHEGMLDVLDYWIKDLEQVARAETLLSESLGLEMVRERREGLENKGQLSADQLAKLAQILAPKIPSRVNFWEAFARRFVGEGEAEGIAHAMTEKGKSIMEDVFPEGAGPELDPQLKTALLMEVKKPGSWHEKEMKDREEERERLRAEKKEKKKEKAEAKKALKDIEESSSSEAESKNKKQKQDEMAGGSSSSTSESTSEDEDPEVRQKRIREKRLLNKQKKRALENEAGTDAAKEGEPAKKQKKSDGPKKPLSKEEAEEKRRLQRERRLKMKIDKRRKEKAKRAEAEAKKAESEKAKQAEIAKKQEEKKKQAELRKKEKEKTQETEKLAESEPLSAEQTGQAKDTCNSRPAQNEKDDQDQSQDENEGHNVKGGVQAAAGKNAKEVPVTYISAEEMKKREAEEAKRRKLQRERRKAAKAKAACISLD